MRQSARLLAAVLAVGGSCWLARPTFAAPVTISDYNASLTMDPVTGRATSWTLNGQDTLDSHGFWFRAGNMLKEQSLDGTSLYLKTAAATNTRREDPLPDTLSLLYQNSPTSPTFTVVVSLSLQGDSSNANKANMSETVRITNKGSTPLNFSLFQFMDLDLAPTNSYETVSFTNANTLVQYGHGSTMKFEQSVIPGLSGREFSNSGVPQGTLMKLTDNSVTNLNSNLLQSGNTLKAPDVSWANQWNYTIPAGTTVTVLITTKMSPNDFPAAPLPSAACMGSVMLAGMGLLAGRRMRQK